MGGRKRIILTEEEIKELDKEFEDVLVPIISVPRRTLHESDTNCDHKIESQWSGVKCVKCGGWFCY